ncbi:MAG: preprotein translocase subunit YajC [Anaerovoracaceae bacterium]|jgi:preprotein translocase subunit YajC
MQTLYSLMPLFLLIIIMYFLLIRPQKKREKQVNTMRANIKAGDEIVTIGGIYGTVMRVKDDNLVIQVGADKTKLEIARWSVSNLVNEVPATTTKTKKSTVDEKEQAEKTPQKSRPKKLERVEPVTPSKDEYEKNPLENE